MTYANRNLPVYSSFLHQTADSMQQISAGIPESAFQALRFRRNRICIVGWSYAFTVLKTFYRVYLCGEDRYTYGLYRVKLVPVCVQCEVPSRIVFGEDLMKLCQTDRLGVKDLEFVTGNYGPIIARTLFIRVRTQNMAYNVV